MITRGKNSVVKFLPMVVSGKISKNFTLAKSTCCTVCDSVPNASTHNLSLNNA